MILCLAILLCACGGDLVINGELLSVYTDKNTGNTLYTIRTADGKNVLVTLATDGFLFEWPEAIENDSVLTAKTVLISAE